MTQKYLSEDEREEIKKLYLTGKYTLNHLAKKYYVSKGTIINTLRNYPYTSDKVEFWRRVYREITVNLDIALEDIKMQILDSLSSHDNVTYSMLMRQEEYLLSFIETPPEELFQKLRRERSEIEKAGWGHIAQEDYQEFAYCQGLWHKLNFILGDHRKNPWGEIPKRTGAKNRAVSVKYFSKKDFKEFREHSLNKIIKDEIISKELYTEIQYCISSAQTGRPLKNPRYRLEMILRLFITGDRPEKVCPKTYRKIYHYYNLWYRTGVFRLLWELNEKYTELEPVRPALLFIERHRMLYPDTPPRFSKVQEANKMVKQIQT